MDFQYSSALEIAKLVRERRASCREVVQQHLQRVKAVNGPLNALVYCDVEGALAAAAEADAALERGEAPKPLTGVPLSVKDLYEVQGMPSTSGTLGRATYRPPQDATVVARLRSAGAILLGKSNTPEFGVCLETTNLVAGTTHNPYDLLRTPGGSSGGGAAALASGLSALEIGSDGGGSIRLPAHFCGVVGLKPTASRISKAGHFPGLNGVARNMAGYGPMARSVADVSLAFRLMLGEDPRDPNALPSFEDPEGARGLRGLRVAFFTDNGIRSVSAETTAMVERCARLLEVAGALVEPNIPPDLRDAADIHFGLLVLDRCIIDVWKKEAGTEKLHPWVESGMAFLEESAETFDSNTACLLCDDWEEFKRKTTSFMESYDVLLSPVAPGPALPHEQLAAADNLDYTSYCCLQNLTGYPSVSLRCGTSAEGLPLGVQVTTKSFRDGLALSVAAFLESELGGFVPPNMGWAK